MKAVSFGKVVQERRNKLGLTQAELGRRVGCAAITIRKIEADDLRPSVQIAEHLAVTLHIPETEQTAFVRLAREERDPTPIPTPSPSQAEIGKADLSGRAIRGYQLHDRIGVGSYGAVYRAVQPSIERDVAVKIILPKIANEPEFIRRFEMEAQLIAKLEHPHIVPLYDYWREPNAAYLIMRYLRGGSLDARLKAGPLTDQTALALLEQICAGLYASHRAGVVHRDIKPANILLDEDDNAYLADFGIAKNMVDETQAAMTQSETILGSPAYISPEQILAEPIKPQTDIYCLGIVLFEMLTGRKPFQGPTPIAYIQQHLNEPLPLLAKQNGKPATPTALDIVIGRATAKDPQERYSDMLRFLEDLRQAFNPKSTASDFVKSDNGPATSPRVAALIDLPDLENPYKGLRPFFEADSDDFFGRDGLIQALLARLGDGTDLSRFLAVIGPSGSGKSSVVRAGLLPALRQGGLPGSETWFIIEMIPGTHPLEELEAALLRIAVNPPESLLSQLQESERGLLRAVQRVLPADEGSEKPTELVLVIDQFEEIFTLVRDETVRTHFLDSLVTAVLDPRSRLRVIVTLRADFSDRPLHYVDFGDLVRQRAEFVLPLLPDELEQAIIEPTRQAGLQLEPGLSATIIDDIGHEPGTLPLLQYALTELFERRSGRLLTLSAYQESGGVLGALARRAEEIYLEADQATQAAIEQLFLRLVTLGEGVEDTRRRVLQSELATLATNELFTVADIEQISTTFVRYRLLTLDHDPMSRNPTVEVAHEALIREWQRLRTWLDDSRTDIRLQRLLAQAAAEWREAEQNNGFLLQGARLDQYKGWAEEAKIALTDDEQLFLNASLVARQTRQAKEEARQQRELETAQKLAETEAQRAAEQAQSTKRLSWLAVGLALFLAVAIGAAWFALNQRNEAQANFLSSERNRLAAQAQIALDKGEDVILPALLALRSLQIDYSPEADAALLSALSRGMARQTFVGHTDAIGSAVFSPDGRYVLTGSNDTTVRLWDAQTGQEIRQFIGHTEFVSIVTFSPDGEMIITGSADGTVRLWNVETGKEVQRFVNKGSPIWGLAVSSNGKYMLTSDESGSAWLWDFQKAERLRELIGHNDVVLWGTFSSNGRYAVTGSVDKTARLWNVETGQEIHRFEGHANAVSGGQFSNDGQRLLTASFDNTARLWNVETGQREQVFLGHTSFLRDAVFSPDGNYVLAGSEDKSVRLWDIETGLEVRQFLGHTAGVSSAIFSPDGQSILTSSVDRTARLWDIQIESEPRHFALPLRTIHSSSVIIAQFSSDNSQVVNGYSNGAIVTWDIQTNQQLPKLNNVLDLRGLATDLILSPAGNIALTAKGDGVIQRWDVQTGQELTQFMGHTKPVWDIAFSPTGDTVLTGSEDGTARLWDAQSGTELHRLIDETDAVLSVAFSPDGQNAITGHNDGGVRLWRVQTGSKIHQLTGHIGPVRSVAFSPDGRYILTGGDDKTARLWDIQTGEMLHQFLGHTDSIWAVAFSPDGRYILTGGDDLTARLWDIETGQIIRQLEGHLSSLRFLTFSSDGHHILTGDLNSTRLWRTRLDDVIALTCDQLPRDFTAEERALYQVDDSPTCS